MTELLMQRLADIAEEEDIRVHSNVSEGQVVIDLAGVNMLDDDFTPQIRSLEVVQEESVHLIEGQEEEQDDSAENTPQKSA